VVVSRATRGPTRALRRASAERARAGARDRIELPDHPFDGHGEPVNVAFAVSCPCGGKQFVALGQRLVTLFEDECA
jgi:hypothetical protein